jgi:hypothetical protein
VVVLAVMEATVAMAVDWISISQIEEEVHEDPEEEFVLVLVWPVVVSEVE